MSAQAQEYYVRGINDAEARGPFTLEQLASLAESGQVTQDTYFYDTTTEQWLMLGSNEELKGALWPEKKKLGFKQAEFKAVNQDVSDSAPPITVEEFLAAAEGKTDETKGRKDKNVQMMQASIWGTRSCAIIMAISAVALALPSIDAIMALDYAKILERPLIILGVLDAVLALLLFLGVITLYPFVRFRAVFGLGFLGFIFWTQDNPTAILALLAGTAGLYFCTIFLNYIPLAVAALAGIGGMLMLASMSIS
ncbi:MAG TPA: DUF4339 domain-containing protein [Candidatus Didemnitutus sp.]|nr:DUF4339 domain-containing protein [Candidatus Didemnitutus sp.]